MRRPGWIFLAAILLPSLLLAWLAVRSARDQQVILQHQQAIISQDITDALGQNVRGLLEDSRPAFIQAVQELLRKYSAPRTLARGFDSAIRQVWDLAEVGFAVSLDGEIYSPAGKRPASRTFRSENDRFLGNRENVPVFSVNPQPRAALPAAPVPEVSPSQAPGQQQSQVRSQSQAPQQRPVFSMYQQQNGVPPAEPVARQAEPVARQVVPQQNFAPQKSVLSNSLPADSDFRRIVGTETSGSLARFLEDNLRLIVWYRPPGPGKIVFGAQISRQNLIRALDPLLQSADLHRATDTAYCLAILDDRGKPVALSRAGFQTDWKHPFVASEIGDGLPHWEAALYLTDPQQIGRSASTLQFTLAALVMTLVATILLGGWSVSSSMRRQLRLAQQKTDFVGNVSHELKTPLTSIRMFADMLAEGRVTDPDRRGNYLRIISMESARLTRLIDNVLTFARMERGIPSGDRRPCDLVEIVREAAAICRPQLENVQATLGLDIQTDTLPVSGDRDSLAQIVLNLLSNAEKYGGHEILVCVRRGREGFGIVEVLDRGPGIPPGKREAVFRPFHRLDDSLESGVSGSGLGLTLARRMARENGGDVSYSARPGGGGCFTLAVPVADGGRME